MRSRNSKNSDFVLMHRAVGSTTMRSVAEKALQARVEGAAVEVKATTLACRNKNKFIVPAEIRDMASVAAQCRDPVKKKV